MRYLVLALACASASAASPDLNHQSRRAGADTTVALQTFQVRPNKLVISRGTRVTWTNLDDIEHTVTAGAPDSLTGDFSGILATKGSSVSHTFDRAGTFTYFCDRHRFMRGEIRVTSSTGE
jgi:plastocyanin